MAYLVKSGVEFRAEINARWPRRDKRSDGWIGDPAHQARVSDHNPDKTGAVRATDTDVTGIHRPTVVAAAIVHPATEYVISNRRIYQRSDRFRPRVYTGSNPHTEHIHRSTRHTGSADNDTSVYPLIKFGPQWVTLRKGAKGRDVSELQALLNAHGASLSVDGDFGAGTEAAVKAFQKRFRVAGGADGIVGTATRTALVTR